MLMLEKGVNVVMSRAYKTLDCWKYSIDAGVYVYELTKKFPKDEMYRITSQIRRAVVSISNNISEGTGVKMKGRYIYHLRIAIGSANEVGSLAIISNRLGDITISETENIEDSLEKIRMLLYGLINRIQTKEIHK